MSEAAGRGEAGPAEAVSVNGVGEPPHVQLAYAQAEVTMAQERVERLRRKVAKAKAQAKTMVDDATAALAAAQADLSRASKHAETLEREAG
jgi:multidrug resistance efflux pump